MTRLIAVLAFLVSCSCGFSQFHTYTDIRQCKEYVPCMKVFLMGKRLDKHLKLQGETKVTVKRLYVHQ